jgi:hypothetical protein
LSLQLQSLIFALGQWKWGIQGKPGLRIEANVRGYFEKKVWIAYNAQNYGFRMCQLVRVHI